MNTKNIKEVVKTQIEEMTFNSRIPDDSSLIEDKLKEIKELLNKKFLTAKIIGEVISNFAFEEVLDKTKSDESTEGSKKFKNLTNVDSDSVSQKVLDFYNKLPEKYTFIFRLPKSSKEIEKLKFLHNIELLTLTKDNIGDYVSPASQNQGLLEALASGRNEQQLTIGDVILKISGKGYVGKYGVIKLNFSEDPLFIFKVIIGIYVALGIIHRGENDRSLYSLHQ
jgi:hypothetical protein